MRAKTLEATVERKEGTMILSLRWTNAYLAEVSRELGEIGGAVSAEWGGRVLGTQPMPQAAIPIQGAGGALAYQSPGWTARITIMAEEKDLPDAREVLEKTARNFTS